MQYVVIFIGLAVAGALAVVLFRSSSKGSTEPLNAATPILGLAEPDPVLAPVMLPQHPRSADVDAVRLAPALRGYRCEQVDAVLDALGAELDRLDAEVQRLTALTPEAREGAEDVLGDANIEQPEDSVPGPHSL